MSVDIIVPIIIAIIAAAPGTLALLRQAQLDKQKMPQDQVSEGMMASKTAAEVVAQYSAELRIVRTEMRELRKEIDDLQDLLDQWQAGIKILISQIYRSGNKPEWEPKTRPLSTMKQE